MARETKTSELLSRVKANKAFLKFRERKRNRRGSSGKHQGQRNQT